MGATRLSLETDLRYARRDAGDNYSVPSSQYWSVLNRAVRAIYADLLMGEKTNSITGDGSVYSFLLRGTHSVSVLAPDFVGVKGFYHANGVVDGPVDIGKIRQRFADGLIVAGDPTEYAVYGGYVFFDYIPSSGLVVYSDYYGEPTDMSIVAGGAGDATAPPSPLDQFDGVILAKAKQIWAGDDGDLAKFDQFRSLYKEEKIPLVQLIESGGKHQTLSNTVRRRVI